MSGALKTFFEDAQECLCLEDFVAIFYRTAKRIETDSEAFALLESALKIKPHSREWFISNNYYSGFEWLLDVPLMWRPMWRLVIAKHKSSPNAIIAANFLPLCLMAENEGVDVTKWDRKWFIRALPYANTLAWLHTRVNLCEKIIMQRPKPLSQYWICNVNEIVGYTAALVNLYDLGLYELQGYVIYIILRWKLSLFIVWESARCGKIDRRALLANYGAMLHQLMQNKRVWRVVGAVLIRHCRLTLSDFVSVGAVLRY
jgi:hypothetical protein